MTPGVLCRGLRGLSSPRFGSRRELENHQSTCLRRLVAHAYARVPYYRRLLDEAGVSPREILGIADLHRIPTTERADLQLLPATDVCAGGWLHHTNRTLQTSGSSGAPLVVRRTQLEERLLLAYRAKAVGAWGFGGRARRVNIDHLSPSVLATEARPMFYEKLGIMPRLNLDWRTPRPEIVARIAAFKPHLISGPPSLLAELADDLSDCDRARISATRVLTGSEVLSASARARIERGFGCPVADIYGCVEIVFIGMEAPGEAGYRLCEEAVIVEVLANGAPAAKGEIHVTGLHQWSMPFIRYRLGDAVEVADGGGAHRVLRSIDGRVSDQFRLPDGRRLLGYELGGLVEGSSLRVRRFQIIQVQHDMFHVRLVLDATSPTSLAQLDLRFRAILGPAVTCTLEVVTSLDRPHRKFHPFVSYERLQAMQAAGVLP